MKFSMIKAMVLITILFWALPGTKGPEKTIVTERAPSTVQRSLGTADRDKTKWRGDLVQACRDFRRLIRDGAKMEWPEVTSVDLDLLCDCFARNFLAVALTKDAPAQAVKFFVESYNGVLDSDIPLAEIPAGCANDFNFNF